MRGFVSTENEPFVRILALAPARASEVSKVYPPCDADQVFNFDVVMRPLNKNKY